MLVVSDTNAQNAADHHKHRKSHDSYNHQIEKYFVERSHTKFLPHVNPVLPQQPTVQTCYDSRRRVEHRIQGQSCGEVAVNLVEQRLNVGGHLRR